MLVRPKMVQLPAAVFGMSASKRDVHGQNALVIAWSRFASRRLHLPVSSEDSHGGEDWEFSGAPISYGWKTASDGILSRTSID